MALQYSAVVIIMKSECTNSRGFSVASFLPLGPFFCWCSLTNDGGRKGGLGVYTCIYVVCHVDVYTMLTCQHGIVITVSPTWYSEMKL